MSTAACTTCIVRRNYSRTQSHENVVKFLKYTVSEGLVLSLHKTLVGSRRYLENVRKAGEARAVCVCVCVWHAYHVQNAKNLK